MPSDERAAGPLVRLRPPGPGDCADLYRWRSDAETQRLLMGRSVATSMDDVEAWIARRIGDPDGVFYVIAHRHDDLAVGFVQLTRIDRVDRHAHLGLFVDAAARGTGAAGEALALIESVAAVRLRLHKLIIEVLATNGRARRFWESSGFRLVGTLEEHFRHGGAFHDVLLLEKRIGS